MADPYLSAAALRAATSIPSGLADADVDRALMAASRAVEKLCNRRTFHLDAAETTRTYSATGAHTIRIDDAYVITEVTSLGTAVASTEWVAQPFNAPVDGEPYLWIEASRRNTAVGPFSTLPGAIEVTGRFGWPVVPPQVDQFVLIVASKLLKRTREAPFGVVQVGGLEGAAMRLAKADPDTMLLIEPLMRHHPAVA